VNLGRGACNILSPKMPMVVLLDYRLDQNLGLAPFDVSYRDHSSS
jgi:hypothetical protein